MPGSFRCAETAQIVCHAEESEGLKGKSGCLFCPSETVHILKGGRTALPARRMRRSKEAEAWREGGEDGWRCPSACRRMR